LILDHTKSCIDKIHSTDAELAGHAHKLDKTAEFVWEWFMLVVCMLAKPYIPLRSELTNNTLQKQRWDTFLYPQF